MKRFNISNDYNYELWSEGVYDDNKSGRNWIYACLNPFRQIAETKAEMKQNNFMLSSSYIYYYDIYEKCLDGNLSVDEKGDFERFRYLANKYGLVPMSAMPDSACAGHKSEALYLVNNRLGYEKMLKDKGKDNKEKLLTDIRNILNENIGAPPERFRLQYMGNDGEIKTLENLTPKDFMYFFCTRNINDYSVQTERIKELAARQIESGEQVIISCDIRHQSNQMLGVLDTDFIENDEVFGDIKISMSRKEKIKYGIIEPTRYLTLDGVHIENGEIIRFKAQDTSGADTGADGHYTMSAKWFDEYVLSAIIKKDYLG